MNSADPDSLDPDISSFRTPTSPSATAILSYLEDRLPGYPFDPTTDHFFVDELIEDFPNIDVLEQVKAFRWFHGNNPAAKHKNLRIALRRWLSNAFER